MVRIRAALSPALTTTPATGTICASFRDAKRTPIALKREFIALTTTLPPRPSSEPRRARSRITLLKASIVVCFSTTKSCPLPVGSIACESTIVEKRRSVGSSES